MQCTETDDKQIMYLLEAQPVKKLNACMGRTGRAIFKLSIEIWY